MKNQNKRVAVVLCGSGFLDGSEIRESVGTIWALSQHPVEIQFFAPDMDQVHVINTLTGKEVPGETRNQRVEAARIARGDVVPLSQFRSENFFALVIPGGYGVAKNLCNFATRGEKALVCEELKSALIDMHRSKKHIGAICIAPALIALAFQGTRKLKLTVGGESDASKIIEKLGHTHVVCQANEICNDQENRVISTPAYMHDYAPLHEIFTGIKKLVDELME